MVKKNRSIKVIKQSGYNQKKYTDNFNERTEVLYMYLLIICCQS